MSRFPGPSYNNRMSRKGITIIEVVLGVALFIVVAGIGLITLNPGRQLASARNKERQLHLNALMLAVRQNVSESITGRFTCSSGALPTSTKKMASTAGDYNIAPCLVPQYIPMLPVDPGASGAHYSGLADYDTGYFIVQSSSTTSTLITITAPSAELGQNISLSR